MLSSNPIPLQEYDTVHPFIESVLQDLTDIPSAIQEQLKASLSRQLDAHNIVTQDTFNAHTRILESALARLKSLELKLQSLEEAQENK